jgi:hypothetical protein
MGNQKDLLVEADFLADGTGKVCRRPREYVVTNRDFIVSPRATAQLEREIIEYASADEAAPSIDLDMLVHMLLSITSEQNMRPEFAGDVPTDAEVAKLQRELPKMGLEETHEYSKRLIPDEIASSLFNLPLKYCRTPTTCGSPRGRRDRRPPAWARRPPRHSRSPQGSTYLTPCASVRESSSAATTPIRSGSPAMNCSPTAPPRPRSIYLFANMALPPNDYKTKLQEVGTQGQSATSGTPSRGSRSWPSTTTRFVMLRHQWALDRLCGGQRYFEARANFSSGALTGSVQDRGATMCPRCRALPQLERLPAIWMPDG